MSQFMLLIRNQGVPMEGLSQEEIAGHMQKWGAWMGGLGEQGKLVGGDPFEHQSAAVLSANGNNVSDGPHTESGVTVGGYVTIKAGNLAEAVEIAKGCPAMESPTSTIEVREFMTMPEM